MRLDQLLVNKGLAPSRTLAQKLIKEKCVEFLSDNEWMLAEKSSVQLDYQTKIRLLNNNLQKYVSRAGLKLEYALQRSNFPVKDITVLDIGQSTGGFSDCLLQHGVREVIGVDVGHDQLHPSLRKNDKVLCFEGINARTLSTHSALIARAGDIGLVVMDLSFISQTLVLPQIAALIPAPFHLISLVKPQFEVGKEGVGKGGLVRDPRLYHEVEQIICNTLRDLAFTVLDYFDSPIEGGDGNKEFFVYACKR